VSGHSQNCQGCWDEDIIEGSMPAIAAYPSNWPNERWAAGNHWTASQLKAETETLAGLPFVATPWGRLVFVHGSPNSPARILLADMNVFHGPGASRFCGGPDTLLCGHTHSPLCRRLKPWPPSGCGFRKPDGAATSSSISASSEHQGSIYRLRRSSFQCGSVGRTTAAAAPRPPYITVDERP